MAIRTIPSVPLSSLICFDGANEQNFVNQVVNGLSMVIGTDIDKLPVSRKASDFIGRRVNEGTKRTTVGTMRRFLFVYCFKTETNLIQLHSDTWKEFKKRISSATDDIKQICNADKAFEKNLRIVRSVLLGYK